MENDGNHEDSQSKPARARKLTETVLRCVERPRRRSPLFWWLLEHHDQLRQSQAKAGLGLQWAELCEKFAEESVTLSGGKPVTPKIAANTWLDVRKEMLRIQELLEQERAEQLARRATDPRRNMPSRFGKAAPVGPPLADVQPSPQLASTQAARSGGNEPWRNMKLPEALADVRVFDADGSLLDLRQFIRDDGVQEPWEDPDMTEIERIGCMKLTLQMRAKYWAKLSPFERRFTKKW